MGREYLMELLRQKVFNILVVFLEFPFRYLSSHSYLVSFQSLIGAVSWLKEEHAKVILNSDTCFKAHFPL